MRCSSSWQRIARRPPYVHRCVRRGPNGPPVCGSVHVSWYPSDGFPAARSDRPMSRPRAVSIESGGVPVIRASRNMTTATLQPCSRWVRAVHPQVWRRRTTPPSWAMRSAVRHRRQWRHRSPAQTSDSSSQTVESTMGGGGCAVTVTGDHSTTIAKGSASSDHWLSDQEIADARHDTSATQPISTRVTSQAAATVAPCSAGSSSRVAIERRGLLRARQRRSIRRRRAVRTGHLLDHARLPQWQRGPQVPVRSSTSVTVSGCSRSPRERSRSRSSIRAASPGRSRWSSSSRSPAAAEASGAGGDVRVPVPRWRAARRHDFSIPATNFRSTAARNAGRNDGNVPYNAPGVPWTNY